MSIKLPEEPTSTARLVEAFFSQSTYKTQSIEDIYHGIRERRSISSIKTVVKGLLKLHVLYKLEYTSPMRVKKTEKWNPPHSGIFRKGT